MLIIIGTTNDALLLLLFVTKHKGDLTQFIFILVGVVVVAVDAVTDTVAVAVVLFAIHNKRRRQRQRCTCSFIWDFVVLIDIGRRSFCLSVCLSVNREKNRSKPLALLEMAPLPTPITQWTKASYHCILANPCNISPSNLTFLYFTTDIYNNVPFYIKKSLLVTFFWLLTPNFLHENGSYIHIKFCRSTFYFVHHHFSSSLLG